MGYIKKVKGTLNAGLKTALAYRFDFFVTLVTAPISLIIYYFLWSSIFAYSGETVINGFTLNAMISYYVLNMIVGFFTWSDIEKWIQHDILRGELVFELLKPLRHMSTCLFFEGGINLLGIIIQAVPLLLVAVLFFSIEWSGWVNLVLFILSIMLAFMLYFMISYLIGLAAFWLKRVDGISRAKKPIITFLAGGLIPITFFPEGVQNVLKYLPFQYIRFVPINIYLGTYTVVEALKLLSVSAIWLLLLYVIIRLGWSRAMNKFTGAGV
ncbi:ABC-2 family transporter protein [Candidatus Woesearchaeota archaeon]|nr:ABC-2 family transporter protein [Candidatus Woesearchaeota archaeon]